MSSVTGGDNHDEPHFSDLHKYDSQKSKHDYSYGVTQKQSDMADADTERWSARLIKIEYQDDKCRLIFEDGDYVVPPVLVHEDHFTLPIDVTLYGQGYGCKVRGVKINGVLVYYNPPLSRLSALDEGMPRNRSRGRGRRSEVQVEEPKLTIQLGKAYTDGDHTAIIVSKLNRPIWGDAKYEYVSHTGSVYTETGKGLKVPNLIMEWKMAEEVYCEENIRGFELLQKHGGNWLGTVHEWIQCNAINGDRVIWGSHKHLQLRGVTVFELEHLAARIAAAGINQYADEHYLLRALKKAKESSS